MKDTIYRQDAIDAVNELTKWYYETFHEKRPTAIAVIYKLMDLPSAEPERKTGKWVNNINDIPICNQCGYMTPYDRAIDDYEYGNYCPNCGASMEVEDEAD